MIPKSNSNVGTHKKICVRVPDSDQSASIIWAYADSVTGCSSKERCKYKHMYGLIQVYADSDTVCLSNSGSASINYTIEGRSLEVREMQEPQEYAQSQVSEETESRRLLH